MNYRKPRMVAPSWFSHQGFWPQTDTNYTYISLFHLKWDTELSLISVRCPETKMFKATMSIDARRTKSIKRAVSE